MVLWTLCKGGWQVFLIREPVGHQLTDIIQLTTTIITPQWLKTRACLMRMIMRMLIIIFLGFYHHLMQCFQGIKCSFTFFQEYFNRSFYNKTSMNELTVYKLAAKNERHTFFTCRISFVVCVEQYWHLKMHAEEDLYLLFLFPYKSWVPGRFR